MNGAKVREILLRDWDPIGVGHSPHWADEYDGYVGDVSMMLTDEATGEAAIVAYLLHAAEVRMGMSGHDRLVQISARAARSLIELRAELSRSAIAGVVMGWRPIAEQQILGLLDAGCARMSPTQANLWAAIRIVPEKWMQHPWGDEGGGFWAVAVIGRTVVWYNDIEDGFNRSTYSRWGVIDAYWCDQDELEGAVQHVRTLVETGHEAPHAGPPLNATSPRIEER